jgi:hypothetical protein
LAISPDGERLAALPVILHDLGNGFGQSLHGLVRYDTATAFVPDGGIVQRV